eukprot:TRINITY_DN3796_c0_g2_i3.p1 TRINITY_DN3796_c0_g2~~TRINITY_DN3796_c0_g2_i3.p1  ORF type:complete len:234 (+),score=22.49 TRINITY_DN3796_c0_g2_i3:170-871(+)
MSQIETQYSNQKRRKKINSDDNQFLRLKKNKSVDLNYINKQKIYISDFDNFSVFECKNSVGKLTLEIFHVDDLDKQLKEWIFQLCKLNMQEMYKSVWGWNGNKKKRELFMKNGNYIIAFDQQKIPAGYCIFRFENEGNSVVQYIYELQLEKQFQRQGLGKKLMDLAQKIGRKLEMEWIMLTTLTENQAAFNFYHKLGFEFDESDPQICDENDQPGYRIMSKYLCEGQPDSKYG